VWSEHADGREGQGGLGADEECRGLRTGGGVWARGDDVVVVVVVVLTDNGASSGVVTSMSAVKDLLVDDRAISITAVSSDAILQAHGRLGTRTRSCTATIAGIAVGHATGQGRSDGSRGGSVVVAPMPAVRASAPERVSRSAGVAIHTGVRVCVAVWATTACTAMASGAWVCRYGGHRKLG
jgi:hypothetical protein